jgi:hypothetical protein
MENKDLNSNILKSLKIYNSNTNLNQNDFKSGEQEEEEYESNE